MGCFYGMERVFWIWSVFRWKVILLPEKMYLGIKNLGSKTIFTIHIRNRINYIYSTRVRARVWGTEKHSRFYCVL